MSNLLAGAILLAVPVIGITIMLWLARAPQQHTPTRWWHAPEYRTQTGWPRTEAWERAGADSLFASRTRRNR